MTYTYVGSMTYLFESDTTKSFLNKLNLKTYSDSLCSGKIGHSSIQNGIIWFLRLRLLAWISSISDSLMPFSYFPCLKTSWIFKSSSIAHVMSLF
jgi:hypothetical protein